MQAFITSVRYLCTIYYMKPFHFTTVVINLHILIYIYKLNVKIFLLVPTTPSSYLNFLSIHVTHCILYIIMFVLLCSNVYTYTHMYIMYMYIYAYDKNVILRTYTNIIYITLSRHTCVNIFMSIPFFHASTLSLFFIFL